MTSNRFPPGWDEERVRHVLEHYQNQTDEEAVAEDEERYDVTTHIVMEVSADLAPAIRELLARRQSV